MKTITSLFLSQSYRDAWDDYIRSKNRQHFARWDYVILTASNEDQAAGYRAQLEERKTSGFLPEQTRFEVISDPEGKRVGSGGATLNVLRYIAEQEGKADFSRKRILVIHSGGDSKRVPQYSAIGKLFSPVPRELPNGRASTLFDEFIIGMSGVPGRMKDGMLVLSGDVLLLFNPLQIDFSGNGAAAISFKEDVNTGKNHGVFLMGEDGNVARFLHKQSVETLKELDAVNTQGYIDIDTGAVIFSGELIAALYGLISTNGKLDNAKFNQFVNERARLSFYGDFLYPLATQSTLEAYYNEKPEGEYCDELISCREEVWEALNRFDMKLLRLSPAKFIHFGTTGEVLKLMAEEIDSYSYLGWTKQVSSSSENSEVALYNSILTNSVTIGQNCYLEDSYVHGSSTVGDNCILSYVDINGESVPDNIVLHGLQLKNGKYIVRIYGIEDNPKLVLEEESSFLGKRLSKLLQKNSIMPEELWSDKEHSLWYAELYPVCDSLQEAVKAALNIYAMSQGSGVAELWRNADRMSLYSSFNEGDPDANISWKLHLQKLVKLERLVNLIDTGGTVEQAQEIFLGDNITKEQKAWLEQRILEAEFSKKMRLNYYIGKVIGGTEGERYIDHCFDTIQKTVLGGALESLQENTGIRIMHNEYTVKLPLRVNWGGGWSDTPPYCIEQGGTVLNAAILLNGELPVQVTMRRVSENKVIFDSRDMDIHGEFSEIESLQDCSNPYDPFALQKAALIACGVIPREGSSLMEILERLGGGFFMSTEVTGVPKGSGLGTSSILAGACVKCLFEFLGISYTEEELYDHVLVMEQLMSTGGGWQDQVGGVTGGIKYITSRPGIRQRLKVDHVKLDHNTLTELNERFALIYTGQRRLARNLLRDVVGRYIGANPDALYSLNEIQRVASLMRFELERGDIDAFAEALSRHWELSVQLDRGSTNTCIDQIFLSLEGMLDGRMICGAGGGGFLQVVLKKGVSKEAVRARLHTVFQDSGVDVWDCTLI